MAILNLSKRYGEAELEAACGYALSKAQHPRCKFIRSILASGIASKTKKESTVLNQSDYVRGASYYAGGSL